MAKKPPLQRKVAINPARELEVDVLDNVSELEDDWRELQSEGTGSIYQDFDWVRIAYETFDAKNRPLVVAAREKGKLQFVLPLVLLPGIPNKIRWVGGKHANLSYGLFSREFLASPGETSMKDLILSLQQHVVRIAVIHLINQPETICGFPNPMMQLSHIEGPNPLFELDLRPGLGSILDKASNKRKRRLFRQQQRAAEAAGGYELIVPTDRKEIRLHMEEFFANKAERFRELGIKNVFSEDRSREFMMRLATEPPNDASQLLRLYVLEVGGKTRAMYGGGVTGKNWQSCINAVIYDEFAEYSPGEMIIRLMLEHLEGEDFEHFDLGLGYERYKESWCKTRTPLFETIYPLSGAATPFKWYLEYHTHLKYGIKNNSTLWNSFKRLRKLFGRI
ncbi:MAG: GNAT family N-acetyltransferase [Pseudomonadota bacterium]